MSQPPLTDPDALDLRPAAMLTAEDRRAQLESLRLKSEQKITEFFSEALEEVLVGYKGLALNASKEAVREKASRKIIDTFKKIPQMQAPQAQVFIQNNSLVPEMAVMNGRPVQTLEAGPVTVALTNIGHDRKPRLIGPEPTTTPHKSQYSRSAPEKPDIEVKK